MTVVPARLWPVAAITIHSPSGPAWEFLVLFLVVIVGPPLLERARLPGIIGLLLGGYAIGANGLDLIGAGNTTVPELGEIGLLYLMFVAGVELDLALVRMYRRSVALFGLISFSLPMLFGSVIGFSLSWNAPAALLLGALLASHTLLVYPSVRNAGLAGHRAVATAVGATVLTDTAALVVLAAVSGSQLENGSAVSIGIQIAFGFGVLVAFTLVLLPRLVHLAFRYLGTDRIVRYLLAVASFLAAATLATSVGIEGIVGAFFAGLGLNRLVPNEGPLMERLDFFGSAVFVPIFLVSVGMLLDPSVMAQGATLKLAALFVVASLGGKTAAAAIAKRPLRLSRDEAALMLGLTVPQAAATLAATVVGFNIGLFDQSVVNAVLVLILVSILAATLLVEHVKTGVPAPQVPAEHLGKRVLVALEEPHQAEIAFAIGASVAAPDGGVVRGFLNCPPNDKQAREAALSQLGRVGFAAGLDTNPSLLVHNSFAEGIVNAVAAQDPSFVLVGQESALDAPVLGTFGEAVAASIAAPVAIVIGKASKIREVVLIGTDLSNGAGEKRNAHWLAAELARRIAGKNVTLRPDDDSTSFSELEPGQLCIAPATSREVMAASEPAPGSAVMMALDPPYADATDKELGITLAI